MQQPKILVADDSRSVRAILRRTLTAAGYDVILASDGLEAVRSAQRDQPDLVILDIQMPEMDGYTACQEILALEQMSSGIPIVFLTRDTARHLNLLGTQLGAYLPKPVSDERLLSTVGQLLRMDTPEGQANGAVVCRTVTATLAESPSHQETTDVD